MMIFMAALTVIGCCLFGDLEARKKDQSLTDTVQKVLMDDAEANLLKVDVYTVDAVVYLDGDLPQYEQKMRAEELARKVPGVKKVYNKIQVEP